MKYFFMVLISFLISVTGAFAKKLSEKDTIPKVSNVVSGKNMHYLPADTVDHFVRNYGKDSLIHLIDKRIFLSENFIEENMSKFNSDVTLLELMLVARHFNLRSNFYGVDTGKYENAFFYHLYDIDLTKTDMTRWVLDSIINDGINLVDSFKNYYTDAFGLRMIVNYCDLLKMDKELYNILYLYSKSQKINDKIFMYYNFVELNRRCEDISINSKEYQTKLFNELYPANNPKMYYLDTFPKTPNAESINPKDLIDNTPRHLELETFTNRYNPVRMLAYALYGNDVNLKSYSDNLIYLLDAQQKNGSWSLAKKFNYFDSNVVTTFYGLWSLCEFKSKLLKE